MAALSAGSITYTVNQKARLGNSKVLNVVTLALGNGALTYPTGGIPIVGGNLGCPNTIYRLDVQDGGTSGYVFNYNITTGKLQMYTVGGAAGSLEAEVGAAVAPAALTVVMEAYGW